MALKKTRSVSKNILLSGFLICVMALSILLLVLTKDKVTKSSAETEMFGSFSLNKKNVYLAGKIFFTLPAGFIINQYSFDASSKSITTENHDISLMKQSDMDGLSGDEAEGPPSASVYIWKLKQGQSLEQLLQENSSYNGFFDPGRSPLQEITVDGQKGFEYGYPGLYNINEAVIPSPDNKFIVIIKQDNYRDALTTIEKTLKFIR